MKKLLLASSFLTGVIIANQLWASSTHSDYRTALKIINESKLLDKQISESEILKVLNEYQTEIGLNQDSGQLVFDKKVSSLRGSHYHYKQVLNGVNVRYGEVVVSVDKAGAIYRIFNNYYPMTKNASFKTRAKKLTAEKTFDIAWENLRVHGKLSDKPTNEEMYVVDAKGQWSLAHVVYLNVAAPRGAWEQVIDAHSGKILSLKNMELMRKGTESTPNFRSYKGKLLNRVDAFRNYQQKQRSSRLFRTTTQLRDAEAHVFDPDPATTLADSNLSDSAPLATFQQAYQTRTLRDLNFSNGVYRLDGPWVNIVDFEAPNTTPSTSTDGTWFHDRGNNAFNDAMTYFHIDQSQRYIQSLGFSGENGIQEVSITVDTDAVNGDDNSYFNPSGNRMAFGHGCVDDNEDADVILHEYGHAINHSINSSWSGGDTGAMGEGFGDYWAGTYSHSTGNGHHFQVNKVFDWDGISECWGGRVLDAAGISYDADRTYGAHQGIENGYQSDELWSSPLYQAYLELVHQGIPRQEVDQIVLEAQFGLGFGLTMRDLAKETIVTARLMFPNGPHAAVFRKHFEDYEIVEAPTSAIEVSEFVLLDSADNGVPEPGETVDVSFVVSNTGDLRADNILIKLNSPDASAQMSATEFMINSLEPGASIDLSSRLMIQVNEDLSCGDELSIEFETDYDTLNSPIVESRVFGTGEADGITRSSDTILSIPDDDVAGVQSTLDISDDFLISENFNVDMDIVHTYIGDLTIELTSPSGQVVRLHSQSGGNSENILGNYPNSLSPAQSLSAFYGTQAQGTWTLFVRDSAGADVGQLVSWGLNDVQSYICQ